MAKLIHRHSMSGHGAQCGAKPDAFGNLRLSTSGVPSVVTCPDCTMPTQEEQREIARDAILRFAERHRGRHA